MASPLFIVLARVVGRDGALQLWKKRLVALCGVSRTEPYSNSYYWGSDLDGEPDTLWGLEGYYHPVGFFMGHVSTNTFKSEMQKVDEDKLLRNMQGLGSPDYDLHHYDFFSGFFKVEGDVDSEAEDSFVVILHLWAHRGKRDSLLGLLADYALRLKSTDNNPGTSLQSFAVLKELNDPDLSSIYIRSRDEESWKSFQESNIGGSLTKDVQTLTRKHEIHRSQAFIGHIDQKAPGHGR